MAKNNPIRAREELVRQQPTIYTFNFKDAPRFIVVLSGLSHWM